MNRIIRFLISLSLLSSVSFFASAGAIQVSQESSAGANDFDSNVLGHIQVYTTALSTVDFYSFNSPDGSSYNGHNNGSGGPAPISNRTMSFFLQASDGLSFITVHDAAGDGSGGQADMSLSLAGGDTAGFSVCDDASECIGGTGTSWTTDHR